MEKKYLKKFRDSLFKLSKEISSREKNIEDLNKYNEMKTLKDINIFVLIVSSFKISGCGFNVCSSISCSITFVINCSLKSFLIISLLISVIFNFS